MTLDKHLKKLYPIYYFLVTYPKRSVFTVSALVISGLAEAISFAALIPLLGIALGGQENSVEEHGFLESMIDNLFNLVELDVTVSGMLLLIVISMSLKSLLSFYAMKEVGYICVDVEADFRHKLVNSLLHAKWQYYLSNKTGDFSSAVSTQAQSAVNVFRATSLVVAGLLQVFIYSAMSLTISIPVSLLGFLLGVTVMVSLSRYVALARVSAKSLAKYEGTILSTLIDGLRGIKSNKAMGMQDCLGSYLSADIDRLAVLRKRIILSSSALKNFQEPIQVLGIAAALFFLTSYWKGGPEQLLVLILLFYRTGQRLGNIQIYYQQIVTAFPFFWFISNIITSADKEREDLNSGKLASMNESISFNEVSFSYGSKTVLDKISFKIYAGEFITIIGPSGGGKTTLSDMLVGFNEPDSGTIKMDGKNIDGFSKSSVRGIIGYVPQETILFHDTIKQNITFGDITVDDKKIKIALERAGLIDFVEQLPEGLNYVIGEHGGRLSGGQKQRIGLCRALLHSPKILLLDEPTSALDRVSEKNILKTLNDIHGTVTIIAISHQQTFVEASDRQLLLENGRLSEKKS